MPGILEELPIVLLERCRLDPKATIIVGVSGGPDSLCLMDVLRRLGYSIVVAHFNHRLRPEADLEAQAVEATAARLSLPFVLGATDVREQARVRHLSTEQAARDSRYAFLFEQARMHGAQAVAVGHTADDQVETLLMHLIRGAGLTGLTGMAHRTILPAFDKSIPIVRPLLGVGRAATVAYCLDHGFKAVHDSSNDAPEYFRNRVRLELIPLLETYNPRIRDALWRTADSLTSDRALLDEHMRAEWGGAVMRQTPEYVAFDADRLAEASVTERRYLIRLAVQHIAPEQETPFALLDRAARFLSDETRRHEEFAGGVVLIREPGVVYVSRGHDVLPSDAWPQMPPAEDSIAVVVPGRIALAGGWQLMVERLDLEPSATRSFWQEANPFRARLDADRLVARLELRVRRRGDRFEPLGLHGHSQKLSDFFVNAKLPARVRGRWPLLCEGDSIVWVPGFRPADRCSLRESSRHTVSLEISRPR